MRRGYTGPGTNKPTASVSKIRPGRAGAAPAGGPRGRSLRRSRTPPRTPQAAALPARADHAAPITHRRLSTTRRRGGEVARRGEQRPGVDEKGTASVPSCRDLVSPCPHVLMSSCPPVLLSSCPPVLLSSCPHVLVSPCPRVLVEYCYIDGGNGPGAGGRRHECPAWPVGDGAHGERSTWFRTACAFVAGRSTYGEESSDS